MINGANVTKGEVQFHYDVATTFYRLLWGCHIHHGLWEADETPDRAQVQLIERLAGAAGIERRARVLDVGCGMGGTAIHLAKTLQCQVVGVTLSPVQRSWARLASWLNGVSGYNRFLCADAEKIDFPAASFDIVWSVECTEHLFDKARFFTQVARWLRPGGRVAICAWLAGHDAPAAAAAGEVREVCERFLCPSLGTARAYRAWMEGAGLTMRTEADITEKVVRTWEICEERLRRVGGRNLARLAGTGMVRFVDGFAAILQAYRSGAMRYGYFVAEASERLTP